MKLKTDSLKFYRQFYKNTAVELLQSYIKEKLRDFKDPSRKGTRRGDPIGHSRGWMIAVILMALYPALKIREIAPMVPTSQKVLEAWKSRKDFQEEVAKSEKELSEKISQQVQEIFRVAETQQDDLSGLEIRFKGITSGGHYLLTWAGILPWLSPSIGGPIIKDIANQLMKNPEDSLRAAFLLKVQEFCKPQTRAGKRKWEKDHLESTMAAISGGFDSLSKKYSKEGKFLQSFKNYILDVIQGLAWGRN